LSFPPHLRFKGGICWKKILKSFLEKSLKKYWIFEAPFAKNPVHMIFAKIRIFAPIEHPRQHECYHP
jgi:hypothetical protein